jgi:hypothetical protein
MVGCTGDHCGGDGGIWLPISMEAMRKCSLYLYNHIYATVIGNVKSLSNFVVLLSRRRARKPASRHFF